MFSTLEKQIFITLGLSIMVMLLGIFGVVHYGVQLSENMAGQDPENREPAANQPEADKQVGPPQSDEASLGGEPEVYPWALHENQHAGFAFEYPKEYDENPAFAHCGIEQQRPTAFGMGEIGINILQTGQVNLSTYVDNFVADRAPAPFYWHVFEKNTVSVGGGNGVELLYQFGSAATNAKAVFTLQGDRVFVLSLAESDFSCNEPEAFGRLVQTFETAL